LLEELLDLNVSWAAGFTDNHTGVSTARLRLIRIPYDLISGQNCKYESTYIEDT
jgi:hypothetical protein